MLIHSTRFGELEVGEQDIIRFPAGLPGFPEENAFAFLPYQPDSPFVLLQSTQEPDLTFVLVEPFSFFKDYSFELDDQLLEELGLNEQTPPLVFSIVTIPDKVEEMTANLLAPVVINRRERAAAQVVLEKTPYTTRHRLFPAGLPGKPAEGGE